MGVLGSFGESCAPTAQQRIERVMRSVESLNGAQDRFDAEPCKRTAWDLRSHWEDLRNDAGHPQVSDAVREATMPARDKARTSVLTFEGKPL